MKTILVAWAWAIWIRLWAQLQKWGHTVTLLWRKKLFTFWNFVKLNWKKYIMPKKIAELAKGSHFDIIFICTKLHDTLNVLQNIQENKISFWHIIAIQNWLVPDNFYNKSYFKEWLTTISIYEWHTLWNNAITFTYSSTFPWQVENSKTWVFISKILQGSWIPCTPSNNIQIERAKKLLLNTWVNWLSAIYKMNIWDLLEEKESEITALFEESYNILSQKYQIWSMKWQRKWRVNEQWN